jgi:uncharacterized membrane protein HdeD (DUF308 family)
MRWISAVVGVLGLLALVAAIIYFTVPAHSLPSFLGPLHGPNVASNAHRKRRGEGAIALAVVLWVIAGIVFYVDRRSSAQPAADKPATDQPATDQPAADQPAS